MEYPPCKYCGSDHGMGIEDMITGKITPMDICYECLWKNLEINVLEDKIVLDENMTDHLKFLEERLTS